MKIVKTVRVELTEEEREILTQAQEILMDFESSCSSEDDNLLQEMYEERVGYSSDMAIATSIDLFDTILRPEEDEEEEE